MKTLTTILPIIAATHLSAITIEIDYTYDTNNFFDTAEKRAPLEAAAKFFGDLINDNLLEINPNTFVSPSTTTWTANINHPGTADTQTIPGLVVPEDTIIIFAGGRKITSGSLGIGGPGGFGASGDQAWFDRIRGRGNDGAIATPRTDFAPWGGAVTFNTDATWNFSLTSNGPGFEFISTALHEIAHVLGIGTSDVWFDLTSSGFFVGPAANQSWGDNPPAFNGHLQKPSGSPLESPLFNSFQVTHGLVRPVLMLPFGFDIGSNFDVATDLDLSVLVDLGWEIFPQTPLNFTSLNPSNTSLDWPSTSFLDYRIERSTDLTSFSIVKPLVGGDGSVQMWSDPSPPATRAFYRLYSEHNLTAPSSATLSPLVKPSTTEEKFTTISVDPIMVECKRPETQIVAPQHRTHKSCSHSH